jgi:sulfur transfer protein SufE
LVKMTTNFEFDDYLQPSQSKALTSERGDALPTGRSRLTAEQFELLSAYIDGELAVADRRQVESWLDTDPQIQRSYRQMLRLQEGLKTLPVPTLASSEVETLTEQVFARLDRRPRQIATFGTAGAAIAATLVAVLASLLGGDTIFTPKLATQAPATPRMIARTPSPELQGNDGLPTSLMIGLEQPVVNIPQSTLIHSVESTHGF